MSKPRWIDSGVFRTLRTATKSRTLAVIVGSRHGGAAVSSLAQAREALGDRDRTALAEDPGCKGKVDKGLSAVFRLRLPGVITTAVHDGLQASAPDGRDSVRVYGPDSKGLKGAWERKATFVIHLCGMAAEPSSLVLTGKDRKVLLKPDSRYQSFLRSTFTTHPVLFTGFALDDPDLTNLLDDVSGVFNGHVPQNVALVPAGTTDPSTALRASMHYGMTVVEFPAEMSAEDALAQLAGVIEDLEIPKPATGNPPVGFTELTEEYRTGVAEADEVLLDRFDRGDSSSWEAIKAGADAARTLAPELKTFLTGPVEEGKVAVALVRGVEGEGKTTLVRRVAWELAGDGRRVFWREFGAGAPDRYVPEEADDAVAIFVADDAETLDNLPSLLRSLAESGQGKARFLLAADTEEWDRSGLDHRIRQFAQMLEPTLGAPDEGECRAVTEGLSRRGRLAEGVSVDRAAGVMSSADGHLMDRIAGARGVETVRDAVARRVAALGTGSDADVLRRAYLAVAMVHRFGMSLGRNHLSALLDLPEPDIDGRILGPLGHSLIPAGPVAVRTRHPVVARAVCSLVAETDDARDDMVTDLLRSLPGGSVADNSVFHQPSELIRRVRQQGPLAPLTLNRFFEAGEDAATNDVLFWYDRGRADVDFSRWEAALHHFDRALWRRAGDSQQRHHNAAVHAYRARCLLNLNRRKEALAATEEGLRLSSQDAALLRLREKLGGRPPRRGGAGGGPGGRRGGGQRRSGGSREGGGGRRPEGGPGHGGRQGQPAQRR